MSKRISDKEAYIFDFDGVLVDTMEAHFYCYSEALKEAGIPIDKKQFYYQAGMSGREQISYFAGKANKKVGPDVIYKRKKELYSRHINKITLIEINYNLICMLHKSGVRTAIASGSSRSSMIPLIEKFKIPCDVIVSAEDVSTGKPDPQLFLVAAKKMKVAAGKCVVVEDSDVGIEAALRANMNVFRFYKECGL